MMRNDANGKGGREMLEPARLRNAEAAAGSVTHPRDEREAEEAFKAPAKIDDSFFGNGEWSISMPAFIDKYPLFYASVFVGGAIAFLIGVCMYVQYEDSKDLESRERRREAIRRRAMAGAAMGVPHGANFAPRGSEGKPIPPHLRAAVEAAAAAAIRAPGPVGESSLVSKPKAKSAAASRLVEKSTSENGIAESAMARIDALTNATGTFIGMLNGESVKTGKDAPVENSQSTDSGASTPRSSLSSQHSSAINSSSSRTSRHIGICNGTVLMASVHEVIFASSSSWQQIGELVAGQQVIAAGPPETSDTYTMVPIKPRGAVDIKTLVVQEY
jgi:hypothetical protein